MLTNKLKEELEYLRSLIRSISGNAQLAERAIKYLKTPPKPEPVQSVVKQFDLDALVRAAQDRVSRAVTASARTHIIDMAREWELLREELYWDFQAAERIRLGSMYARSIRLPEDALYDGLIDPGIVYQSIGNPDEMYKGGAGGSGGCLQFPSGMYISAGGRGSAGNPQSMFQG